MDYKKLDLDDVSMLVQECLKKLEEMERLLLHEDLTKNKKSLEAEKAQLSEQVERLKTKKKGMEEKISFGDYTIQPKLLQTQQHYQKYDAGTQRIKEFYIILIEKVLCHLRDDLEKNLKYSSEMDERVDTRQTYQVYGLLLSACNYKKRVHKQELVTKVLSLHDTDSQEHLTDNIKKSIILTKDMLTLVPPLLITIVPQEYDEKLHETNRSTWDESIVRNLTYYRPILVYGNQLHVAMKGLVGNTTQKQPQQQGQQLKGDSSQNFQKQQLLPQVPRSAGATSASNQVTHSHAHENSICSLCNKPWYQACHKKEQMITHEVSFCTCRKVTMI